MGLSSAIEWWEEWQLRILALSSMGIQVFLFFSAMMRKRAIPSWFRSIVWLAYLGSDATVIYAMASLFNRHKNQDYTNSFKVQGSYSLEVFWAPILLIHLGGQDVITAYNIEDNELWRRQVLTTVSQITVSVYVFYKSWWLDIIHSDLRMMQAAMQMFVFGVLKCIEKPWALRSASINMLVSSNSLITKIEKSNEEGDSIDISLESYVEEARKFVLNPSDVDGNRCHFKPYMLFVDLSLPYSLRLSILKTLWIRDDVHLLLQEELAHTFHRLYTKLRTLVPDHHVVWSTDWKNIPKSPRSIRSVLESISRILRILGLFFLFEASGIFLLSHKEVYKSNDIKVTYVLLCCTTMIEFLSLFGWVYTNIFRKNPPWSYKVSQCRLIGNYVGSSIKPCDSSGSIIVLVLQHVKSGWKDYITNVASYRMFNDNRGQWSLQRNNCDNEDLAWSVRAPFDESVLLWHLATDLCLLSEGYTNEGATRSIEISNYMMYLLLNNPDMLMAGTKRSLFTTAIHELKGIIGDETLEDIDLAHKIIAKMESSEGCPSFIHNACVLSKALLCLDNTKMWEVIEGVWVEMLCFSASRCRGYLHAKSLGNGGELLTFVWLLLLQMGMEPLAEKLQRAEIPKRGGNGAASAASLSSDKSLALQRKKTEVPSGDEGNIADVPSTSNDSIVIDIGDNAS